MRILLTGSAGQLGRHLCHRLTGHDLCSADLPGHDLCRPGLIDTLVTDTIDVVINAAALTDVDRCEREPEQAQRINADIPRDLARACTRHGARLIHVSTDHVFAGDAQRPYDEDDAPAPVNAYGQSKRAGETAVRSLCANHVILRTAWLYAAGGHGFLPAILRQGRDANATVRVVDDQSGSPTSVAVVGDLITALLDHPFRGLLHGACTPGATRFEFAREVFALWSLPAQLISCRTAEMPPRPAPRPTDTRLISRHLPIAGLPSPVTWREALRHFYNHHPDA